MKKILLSIFLSTIFMANVVAMAGTCDDYNIETRNDNGVEVYSVLIHRILNSQVYLELVIHYTKTIRAIMEQQQHMDGSVYIIMMIILTMCLKVDNLRCGLALAHVIR